MSNTSFGFKASEANVYSNLWRHSVLILRLPVMDSSFSSSSISSMYVLRLIAMVNLVWCSDVESRLVANLSRSQSSTQYQEYASPRASRKSTMLLQWLRARCFFWQVLEIHVRELLPWWTPPGCSSSHWEKPDWDHRDEVLGDMPRIANY